MDMYIYFELTSIYGWKVSTGESKQPLMESSGGPWCNCALQLGKGGPGRKPCGPTPVPPNRSFAIGGRVGDVGANTEDIGNIYITNTVTDNHINILHPGCDFMLPFTPICNY
jgi:hypothetical protein